MSMWNSRSRKYSKNSHITAIISEKQNAKATFICHEWPPSFFSIRSGRQ